MEHALIEKEQQKLKKNNILNFEENILAELLNRILICEKKKTLYVIGEETEISNGIISVVKIIRRPVCEKIFEQQVYFVSIKSEEEWNLLLPMIREYKDKSDFVIYVQNEEDNRYAGILGAGYPVFNKKDGRVYLIGRNLSWNEWDVKKEFNVLAIIHCYNEVDIIEQTIKHVLAQGLDIYLVDNWSTDGTYKVIERYCEKYPERIKGERFPYNGKSEYYDWYHQLERTEQIQNELDYSWYVHYDADEMRISPWENVSLKEMIYQADMLGYNTIDNTVIDFKLTKENSNSNIFMRDVFYDFGHRAAHFKQRKTWKKCSELELKSSGGHMAVIPENSTYPLKILNRHYPLRSVEQAQNKVFRDRKPRFYKEQKERGWHGHYNAVNQINDIIADSSELLQWSEDTFINMYIPLFFGCGIVVDDARILNSELQFCNKRIVIYGAGEIGEWLYWYYVRMNIIVAWIDKDSANLKEKFLCKIDEPAIIKNLAFDYCIVAVKNMELQKEIVGQLEILGCDKSKIKFYKDVI